MPPLHVRGNATNLGDRTKRAFFYENRSQFLEEKMPLVLSPRLASFTLCARGLYLKATYDIVIENLEQGPNNSVPNEDVNESVTTRLIYT